MRACPQCITRVQNIALVLEYSELAIVTLYHYIHINSYFMEAGLFLAIDQNVELVQIGKPDSRV